MKEPNIGMLCQSDYLANILVKSFFRVYGVCSANNFLTNIFTHTKLHQHVGLISGLPPRFWKLVRGRGGGQISGFSKTFWGRAECLWMS